MDCDTHNCPGCGVEIDTPPSQDLDTWCAPAYWCINCGGTSTGRFVEVPPVHTLVGLAGQSGVYEVIGSWRGYATLSTWNGTRVQAPVNQLEQVPMSDNVLRRIRGR